MTAAPRTYAEWSEVLGNLKDGTDDAGTLAAMKVGTLEWQSGVAERFAKRFGEAVQHRMNAATDRFQRDMARTAGQERAIVGALSALRRELNFLYDAADIEAMPPDVRERYRKSIADNAQRIQSSLEDSAKSDRTGKLASIVRNNKVNTLGAE